MKKIVVLVAAATFALTGCSQVNQREVVATVSDKERVCESDSGDCKYLVFTDQGTFENTDALLEGKFNSSDIQGMLQEGQTYTFTVAGFRQGILSMYPNILEVK